MCVCGSVLTLSKVNNLLRIGTYLLRSLENTENRRTANVSFSCIHKERLSLQPLSVSVSLSLSHTHTPKEHDSIQQGLCAWDVLSFTQACRLGAAIALDSFRVKPDRRSHRGNPDPATSTAGRRCHGVTHSIPPSAAARSRCPPAPKGCGQLLQLATGANLR